MKHTPSSLIYKGEFSALLQDYESLVEERDHLQKEIDHLRQVLKKDAGDAD